MEQLITTGGTAGLIAFCLFVIYKFGGGHWYSSDMVEKHDAERDASHVREVALIAGERDRALAAAGELLPAIHALSDELRAARQHRSGDSP